MFDGFDWKKHWYPVGWLQDFTPNKPHKITLFDQDYVFAHGDSVEGGMVCLEDVCPHRLAALSEGRITKDGLVQCAYHGWAFSGETGELKSVPQAPEGAKLGVEACARAVKVVEKMGLVWVSPFDGEAREEDIPIVKEMLDPEYKVIPNVRDMPLDYSVLIENIMDPDHGLYAHQSPAFDLYSATSDQPQNVTVWRDNSGFLRVSSEVEGTLKLTRKPGQDPKGPIPMATHEFIPPSVIQICRRDPKSGETKFMTNFFVSPTGVGKTRFLSCATAKIPISLPRTLTHIQLNNFLDQDTYLVATEQTNVLKAELKAHLTQAPFRRAAMYKYRSPAERLLGVVGKFLDASLPKMPNRYASLTPFLSPCPPRNHVLDRYAQHTQICPDSAKFISNLRKISMLSLALSAASALVFPLLSTVTQRIVTLGVITVLMLFRSVAEALRSEFFYKYDEKRRDRDLRRIDSVVTA